MSAADSPSSRRRPTAVLVESLEPRALLAGDGLAGVYFDNADLTGAHFTRVDASLNMAWAGSPGGTIGGDTFSARWGGHVQAIESGSHTFRVTADDGARLWVDERLVLDGFAGTGTQVLTGVP